MRFSPLPPALKLYKIKYTYTDIYTYVCTHIYIYVLFPDLLHSYKSEGNCVFLWFREKECQNQVENNSLTPSTVNKFLPVIVISSVISQMLESTIPGRRNNCYFPEGPVLMPLRPLSISFGVEEALVINAEIRAHTTFLNGSSVASKKERDLSWTI